MTLLGEVDALANDVVAAILDFGDPILVVHRNTVAHGHRIRRANSLDAEIALYLTIKQLAIVRQNGVPATSILNY